MSNGFFERVKRAGAVDTAKAVLVRAESLYEKGDFCEKVWKLLFQNKFQLILTDHLKIRTIQRQILEESIKENINNPKRLYFARKRKK